MVQERSHASGEKRSATLPSRWWSAWPVPALTLTLVALTVLVLVAGQVGGYTNEPVWPAPGALQTVLAGLW